MLTIPQRPAYAMPRILLLAMRHGHGHCAASHMDAFCSHTIAFCCRSAERRCHSSATICTYCDHRAVLCCPWSRYGVDFSVVASGTSVRLREV